MNTVATFNRSCALQGITIKRLLLTRLWRTTANAHQRISTFQRIGESQSGGHVWMRGAPPVGTRSSSTTEMPTNRYPTTGEQRTPTMPQRSRRPSLVPCPDPFNHHIHSTNGCFRTWLGGSSSKASAHGPHGPRIESSLGLPVGKA